MPLVVEEDKAYDAVISNRNNSLAIRAISHPIRQEILHLLAIREMYAIEIAKKLNMVEQKVYYHLKLLKEAGLIEEIASIDKRGLKAKLLKLKKDAVAYIITRKNPLVLSSVSKDLPPLIENGIAKFRIVVGSPDPHGKYRARARDGFIAAELASILAGGAITPWPFVVTDTDVKYHKGNLVLLGGPVVNTLAERYNKLSPVYFEGRKIISPKKEYTEDWIGFISFAKYDFGFLMFVAGRSRAGTRAAVLYLKKHLKEIINYKYIIVQGFDEDSDNIVDSVEVLEYEEKDK